MNERVKRAETVSLLHWTAAAAAAAATTTRRKNTQLGVKYWAV